MVGTWFVEFCSCCCLPPLPQLACSILPTTYEDLFRALYNVYLQEKAIVTRRIVCALSSVADEAVEIVDDGIRDGYLVGGTLWQTQDLFQSLWQFQFSWLQNLKVAIMAT